jgi:hypothetical protein
MVRVTILNPPGSDKPCLHSSSATPTTLSSIPLTWMTPSTNSSRRVYPPLSSFERYSPQCFSEYHGVGLALFTSRNFGSQNTNACVAEARERQWQPW